MDVTEHKDDAMSVCETCHLGAHDVVGKEPSLPHKRDSPLCGTAENVKGSETREIGERPESKEGFRGQEEWTG